MSDHVGVEPKEVASSHLIADHTVFVERLSVGLGEEGLGGGSAGAPLDRLRVAGTEVHRELELLPHLRPHGLLEKEELITIQLKTIKTRFEEKNRGVM